LKQFLRFQANGSAVLLWIIIFLSMRIDLSVLKNFEGEKIFSLIAFFVFFAIPVSVIVHQISVTMFNPYRRTRFPFFYITRDLCDVAESRYKTDKNAVFKAVKFSCYLRSIRFNNDAYLCLEYLSEELSNRISYYYVRIESGLLAPVLSFLIYSFIISMSKSLSSSAIFHEDTYNFSCVGLLAFFVIYVFIMLQPIPRLLHEMNAIENLMLDAMDQFEDAKF